MTMLKAPCGPDTHCVAALGGVGGSLFPHFILITPPEMGFWYSHGTGEKTGRARILCLGSDLVLRPPSREMGRKRTAVTTVMLTEDAQDGH